MVLQYPYPADQFILVGRVTRSHGLKGEFKVSPLWGPPDTFEKYSRAALVAADGRMTELLDIKQCRVQGKQIILKLDTIDTKNEADLLVSMGVLTSTDDHDAESGDVDQHPHKLIGSPVYTMDGNRVGVIADVSYTGGHPLLIIFEGTNEYLVPLVDKIVVDINNERIIIDPPEGLLEINQPDQAPK